MSLSHQAKVIKNKALLMLPILDHSLSSQGADLDRVDIHISTRYFTTLFDQAAPQQSGSADHKSFRLLRVQSYCPELHHFPQFENFIDSASLVNAHKEFVVRPPEYVHQAVGIPSEHLWHENPYLIPHRLQLAPVFVTYGSRIIMRLFTNQHLQLSLPFISLKSLAQHESSAWVYTGWHHSHDSAHPHHEMFLASKLRYLVAHYPQKVFWVLNYADLPFLAYVRRCLADSSLWLKVAAGVQCGRKQLAHFAQGFMRHDFPQCRMIPLGELKQAWDDPAMIYPFYS